MSRWEELEIILYLGKKDKANHTPSFFFQGGLSCKVHYGTSVVAC